MNWLKYPDRFKELVNKVNSDSNLNAVFDKIEKNWFKKYNNFLNNIMSGEIDNKYTAEKEYLEKIKFSKDYLDKKNMEKEGSGEKLKSIFNELEYAVFGVILPSEEKGSDRA